jgi:hypothetical protein
MKETKTVWDGEKFAEISDAQMPEFIAAYHERADQRAKVNDRIMFVQDSAFFVIPALMLFIWLVAHWARSRSDRTTLSACCRYA